MPRSDVTFADWAGALVLLGPHPFRSIPASFSNTAQTAAVS